VREERFGALLSVPTRGHARGEDSEIVTDLSDELKRRWNNLYNMFMTITDLINYYLYM
jgi:hypothetical protein